MNKIERNITGRRNQWRNESLVEFGKTQATLAALSQQLERHQAQSEVPIRRHTVTVRGPDGLMQALPVGSKSGAVATCSSAAREKIRVVCDMPHAMADKARLRIALMGLRFRSIGQVLLGRSGGKDEKR